MDICLFTAACHMVFSVIEIVLLFVLENKMYSSSSSSSNISLTVRRKQDYFQNQDHRQRHQRSRDDLKE